MNFRPSDNTPTPEDKVVALLRRYKFDRIKVFDTGNPEVKLECWRNAPNNIILHVFADNAGFDLYYKSSAQSLEDLAKEINQRTIA